MQIEQMTNRQIGIEQVRRRIATAGAEIDRIMHEVLPGMILKQGRRREELARQEAMALRDGRSERERVIRETVEQMRD